MDDRARRKWLKASTIMKKKDVNAYMKKSQRIQDIPPYLFAGIEKKIQECREKGIDVISFGIGDPDQPTPDFIIEKAIEELKNPVNHQYPSSAGMLSFREAVANWYQRRFGVTLDPKTEVVNLIGSKEGIANINYCYVDPGDINLVPDPGYPVYSIGTLLAGGTSYFMPLKEENGFLPDLDAIPDEIADKAKILWIGYPNNPTGACADLDFSRKWLFLPKSMIFWSAMTMPIPRYPMMVMYRPAFSGRRGKGSGDRI